MKTYTGERTFDAVVVMVDDKPLPERRDVKQCSQNAFEWGFEGPEVEQLAVALLADAVGEEAARECSAAFMKTIAANFANEWEMTDEQIREAVDALRQVAP